MRTCPYCKKEIAEGNPFCPNCRKPLLVNSEESQVPSSDRFFENLPFYHIDNKQNEEIEEFEIPEGKSNQIIDEKILKIDKKINEKAQENKNVGTLLLEKASLYYKKRDLRTASKILEIALSSFQKNNTVQNIKYTAICYNELGIIKEDLGYFEEAIYNYENSISLLKEIDEDRNLIHVYNNLGNIYFQIKDIENSYKYYQEAIDLAEKRGLVFEEVKSSSNLVEILLVLEDFDRVKKILKRNSDFFIHMGDSYGSITTLIKYGKFYYLQGDIYFQKAKECFLDAFELINNIEDQISHYTKAKLEWECNLYLGKLALLEDKDQEAEEYLLKSLEAIRTYEFGDTHIKEGVILEALGNLYEFKNRFDEAIDFYMLATEVYHKFGEDFKISEIYKTIANINLKNLNDHLEAIFYLEKSLDINDRMGYLKESAEILDKIGDIYVDKNMQNLAIKSFRQAKAIYNDLEDTYHRDIIAHKIKTLNDST